MIHLIIAVQGYKEIINNCRANAEFLALKLKDTGKFNILSKDIGVPLVAFSLKDKSKYDEYQVADQMQKHGWILPAYTMAPDAQNVSLLRAVIREDFTRTLAERLVNNIKQVVEHLDSSTSHPIKEEVTQENGGGKFMQKEGNDKTKEDMQHVSVFDELLHASNVFKVWKKHAVDKTNGVC